MKMMPHQALPVWSGTDVPNQTVAFRTEFTLEILPEQPELLLAADTNVMAWCNGVEAERGQYPDFPWLKSFTRISGEFQPRFPVRKPAANAHESAQPKPSR